jgi:hypothetical protein
MWSKRTLSILAAAALSLGGLGLAGAAANGKAHPQVAPIQNNAIVYRTATSGGTGDEAFTVPLPSPGVYQASFSANFVSTGTDAAPESYSCLLVLHPGTHNIAQSTSPGGSGNWYIGVDGAATFNVKSTNALEVNCGTRDGTAWTWGDSPLKVTLTRLDGITGRTLVDPARLPLRATGAAGVAR